MKIAVVADAISEEAYFNTWKSYYSKAVGKENIFVFSYKPMPDCIFLNQRYCDDQRKNLITRFANSLLYRYDYVIRVDVDEFLVPLSGSLKEYLSTIDSDYVTANGFNIFQSDEPSLDFSRPLLPQRKLMYATGTVNKTCLTRIPLLWSHGFHFCDQPPVFGGLCLFHMKHADRDTKTEWDARMISHSITTGVRNHYARVEMDRTTLPVETNMARTDFNNRFLEKVVKRNGFFQSTLASETINLIIPEALKVF